MYALKKTGIFILGCFCLTSCAVLSNSQLKAVKTFAEACDSVAVYPSQVIRSMGTLRLIRGSYFASSLHTPEQHIEELNALHHAALSDERHAKELDATLEVVSTYMRALKSLVHDNRHDNIGLQLRNIGRDLDSLIIHYNVLDFTRDLPTGILKLTGKTLSFVFESYVRTRQAEAVKAFISEGDTLMGVCMTSVIDVLQSRQMQELMENEVKGLEANYLSYLRQKSPSPDPVEDQRYLALLSQAEAMKKIRLQSINACRSVRRAHAKLFTELQQRRRFKDWYGQLQDAYDSCEALRKTFHNLVKQWKH